MKKHKKSSAHTLPKVIHIFKWFALFLFGILLILVTLNIATSRMGIKKLVKHYTKSVEITDNYYEYYKNHGLSENEYRGILESDEIRDILGDVMYNIASAIFHPSTNFTYTKSDAEKDVRNLILGKTPGKNLSENEVEGLVSYTMDISGITAVYVYDTPQAYQTSILSSEEKDLREEREILRVIASLCSSYILVAVLIMYIFLVVIMVCICEKKDKDKLFSVIADTILFPSFIFLGIAFGKRFGTEDKEFLQIYLYNIGIIVGAAGVVIGLTCGIVVEKLGRRGKELL